MARSSKEELSSRREACLVVVWAIKNDAKARFTPSIRIELLCGVEVERIYTYRDTDLEIGWTGGEHAP